MAEAQRSGNQVDSVENQVVALRKQLAALAVEVEGIVSAVRAVFEAKTADGRVDPDGGAHGPRDTVIVDYDAGARIGLFAWTNFRGARQYVVAHWDGQSDSWDNGHYFDFIGDAAILFEYRRSEALRND